MSRLILLDSGPLGLATNPRESAESRRCKAWLKVLRDEDVRIIVPEVADDEVCRELLRAVRLKGLERLDQLADLLGVLAVTGATWRRAAELWAQARSGGYQTADDAALDGDVILAAQAQLAGEAGFGAIVATGNVGHLGRFVDAALGLDHGMRGRSVDDAYSFTASGRTTPSGPTPDVFRRGRSGHTLARGDAVRTDHPTADAA